MTIELGSSIELKLTPKPYGAAFSHCFVHCLIASECPCPEHVSLIVGILVEKSQEAGLFFRNSDAAQSAMQQSDFFDNALGRSLGKPNQRSPREFCLKECSAEMGGRFPREGPGTRRPFGPYHPTDPGPKPTLADMLGLTMPRDWGPD